ncbi:hypothetical protein FD06_GL000672 [Apilactobacillus ozensis DSM 23829 = JCM 17196]|uniref:Uncharacterized protein n=1 Tax=Apilactobacillus ozensis DSM 23829 = JCM 17196 TaxID=1423781 RepID=A0A0R2AK00_9LACO|nr:hypothetical protein [Apilactobacillus ozensis]KRM67521.1 hypothetical protein FD06_GL000672 [Apilactobacillus ozensis DSM 23829 = JCM 17196]
MKVKLTALIVIILIIFGITSFKRVNRLSKGNYINIYNAKSDLVKKDYNKNNVNFLTNFINQQVNNNLKSDASLPKKAQKEFRYRVVNVNSDSALSITTYKNKYAKLTSKSSHSYIDFYVKLTDKEYQQINKIR